MNDLLLRIQEACLQLDAVQLIVPAVVSIILGLFLWLGGARYAGFLIGLLGAVVGAGCGLFLSQWLKLSLPVAMVIGAALAAIIAVLFQQTVILILAVLIFAAVCGSGYVSYAYSNGSWREKLQQMRDQGGQAERPAEEENDAAFKLERLAQLREPKDEPATNFSAAGGIQKLKEIFQDVRTAAGANRGVLIMCILLGGGVGLAIAYLLKIIIMALCCSIVGTAGVIGGMIALFFAKGVEVFSVLENRNTLIPIIFLGMILFGCLVQSLLAAAHARTSRSLETEKDKEK